MSGYDSSETVLLCEICEEEMDDTDDQIYLTEWLIVDRTCKFCMRDGCVCCLMTCYTCANERGVSNIVCEQCNKKNDCFKRVDCKYHLWYVCRAHQKNRCGECYANENYAGKYS